MNTKLSPIQRGEFFYPECFAAFLRGDANGQKHKTQHVIEELVRALRSEAVVFGDEGQTVDVLDVGCGPGLYSQKFLASIGKAFSGKINYHGVDILPEFVSAAVEVVKSSPNVASAKTKTGNAFEGDELVEGRVALAQASHMVYHAADGSRSEEETDQKVDNFVRAIMDSVANDGIAIFFHGGEDSDMHGKVAKKFGPLMSNAPNRIDISAKKGNKEIVELSVSSKLYFPDLPAATYEKLKDIENYKNFQPDSDELRWLKLLTFVLHCDLKALSANGKLGECIEFTKELLAQNRDRDGGFLMVRGSMQIIMNDPALKPKIDRAVAEVASKMTEIDRRTEAEMAREAQVLRKA